MSPVLLIAEREFRTYVATLSFWLSLAIAPLAAGAALFLSSAHQPPSLVTVKGGDSVFERSAGLAIQEAGRLEGRSFVFGAGGATIVLSRPAPHALDVAFGADFPLSPIGRAMVRHIIERDAARHALRLAPLVVSEKAAGPFTQADAGAESRVIAMIMLWLTLTGSLGMLLQAVVRERANRALESLLAATRPWQIMTGKMLGVGAVSFLVLVAWSGTAASLSLLAGPNAPLSLITTSFSDAATLARDALIYACAYLFYGAITVALGALARDSASAQNLARPMFVLLLLVFLVALSAFANQSSTMSWLTWLPPFTPFLLLIDPPQNVALMTQAFQLGLLLLASAGLAFWGSAALTISPAAHNILKAGKRVIQ